MSDQDVVDLFSLLDPFREEAISPDAERDEAMLRTIMSTPPNVTPINRKRRLWVVGGTLGATVLATAAFAVLRSAPIEDTTGVSCRDQPNLDGDVVGIAGTLDPIEACGELWTNGTFGAGEIPPLAGCINEAGLAVVLPGRDDVVCSGLGLDMLDAESERDDNAALIAVQEQLIDTFLDDCFDEQSAIAESRRVLDAAGLSDWTVEVAEPFPDPTSCAAVGFLPETKTVILAG